MKYYVEKIKKSGDMAVDYVVINLKTVTSNKNSAYHLSLANVENGVIVEKRNWSFAPINHIYINAFSKEPTLKEIWNEILVYINNRLIVVHNDYFNMLVLKKSVDYYKIPYPNIKVICTLTLSREFYCVDNYNLYNLSKYLNYEYLDDLDICNQLFIDLSNNIDIKNTNIIRLGKFKENKYIPFKILENTHNNFFENEIIVFTGSLNSMKRHEASKLMKEFGAIVENTVNKNTTMLIVGSNYALKNIKSSKRRRVEALIKQGQKIKIVTEKEFLDKIESYSK